MTYVQYRSQKPKGATEHEDDTCVPTRLPPSDHCGPPLRVHARGVGTLQQHLIFRIFEGAANVCLTVHISAGVLRLSII